MRKSVKEYLLNEFPPSVSSMKNAYSDCFWDGCDYENAQDLSNQIIELFKENDMTYTDAYAMLGFVKKDLAYRAERVRL